MARPAAEGPTGGERAAAVGAGADTEIDTDTNGGSDRDGVEALMRGGGERLRERMARVELHLERVTAAAGAPLAAHASATIMAGGKRLRPLLVVLAAEAAGGSSADGAERARSI